MKTSNVLASFLLGSMAAAMPLDRRARVTKTSVVVETVVVYTTVYDGYAPATEAAETTTSPGLFYEKPSKKPVPTTTEAAYEVPKETTTSSSPPPPPPPPSTTSEAPKPTSTYVPAPEPTTTEVKQEPTSVYSPPAAPSTSAAPAPAPSSPSTTQPTGEKYSGDITIYDNNGSFGACGKALTDDMMVVAMAKPAWGESTYDVMTGEATNKWCGKTITIEYKGNQIQAEVQDLCPGCSKVGDIDLSLAAWKALTGLDEKTRLQAEWWEN